MTFTHEQLHTLNDALGLDGKPMDEITLPIYGKRIVAKELRDELIKNDQLKDMKVGDFDEMVSAISEKALHIAAQLVWKSRIQNNQVFRYERDYSNNSKGELRLIHTHNV